MTHRSRRRTTALTLLAAAAWLATACGGRFRTINDVDDDTVAGRSSAGASSAGRAGAALGGYPGAGASAGGAPGAGAPGAGAPGAGAGGCGNVNCPLVACPSGYTPVLLPGKCCPVCQSTCQEVACPAVACGPGTHPEVPVGDCCPICVDDAGYACSKGKDQYQQQRAQYADKYSFGCNSDAECTVIAPYNQCESGCQYAALYTAVAHNFSENLGSLASMVCSTCMMQPPSPCPAPPHPSCVNHQCDLGVFP